MAGRRNVVRREAGGSGLQRSMGRVFRGRLGENQEAEHSPEDMKKREEVWSRRKREKLGLGKMRERGERGDKEDGKRETRKT